MTLELLIFRRIISETSNKASPSVPLVCYGLFIKHFMHIKILYDIPKPVVFQDSEYAIEHVKAVSKF